MISHHKWIEFLYRTTIGSVFSFLMTFCLWVCVIIIITKQWTNGAAITYKHIHAFAFTFLLIIGLYFNPNLIIVFTLFRCYIVALLWCSGKAPKDWKNRLQCDMEHHQIAVWDPAIVIILCNAVKPSTIIEVVLADQLDER